MLENIGEICSWYHAYVTYSTNRVSNNNLNKINIFEKSSQKFGETSVKYLFETFWKQPDSIDHSDVNVPTL